MRDLNEIQAFLAVAHHASFDAAARSLGLSGSTVSRRIAQLETRLGVALLQRTTRSVRLTSAGETYREHGRGVLVAAAQADAAVAAHRDALGGELTVNAPLLFGQRVLAPVAAGFARAHPSLRLRIDLTNLQIDPIETGCDLVVRIGELPDSGMRARLLGRATRVVVASPAVIAEHGEPNDWRVLARKPCLVYGRPNDRFWRLPGGSPDSLAVEAVFTSNDQEALRAAALAGAGFAILPRFQVADALDDGRLVALALSASVAPTKVNAIFPGHPILNPAARALVEELVRSLRLAPDWVRH